MMNKLIELKNLTKNFDDQQVLRGINLDIYEKEFLTLLGPSGCGKTTTLRIIAGFEEPSDGEVLFNGIEISKLPPYKREVNTVFQKYALFPHLNVAENIGFGLNLKKVDKTVIAQKVERMLKMVGLEGFGKRDVTLLSGGQQQRVAIARALANDPEIILSDESTSALDPRTTRAILDLLKKVNRELGITIVVITHEMQVIKDICDRVAVMKDGRVVETGTVFDIFANPKEQITREFVENTSNMSRIYELVETKSPVVELKPGEAILRFRYLERNVSEALVSQLSRKFNLDLNIIFGSIELIGENPIGGLVVIAQGTSDNINQAIQYLKDKNVGVEVILDGRTA